MKKRGRFLRISPVKSPSMSDNLFFSFLLFFLFFLFLFFQELLDIILCCLILFHFFLGFTISFPLLLSGLLVAGSSPGFWQNKNAHTPHIISPLIRQFVFPLNLQKGNCRIIRLRYLHYNCN